MVAGKCTPKGDPTYQLFIQRPSSLPLPEVIVPPRGAGFGLAKADDLLRQRDRHVQAIQDRGRMAWQKLSGYNRRALVEATRSCCIRIIGPGLRSRELEIRKTEAMMGIDILNHMFSLGRPMANGSDETRKSGTKAQANAFRATEQNMS